MADHTSTTNSTLIHSTNRRQLLFGTSALALAGVSTSVLANNALASTLPASPTGGAPVPISVTDDPACRAFLVAKAAKDAVNSYRGPENSYYEHLVDHHIFAHQALSATPSQNLRGVHAKIWWLVDDMHWDDDDPLLESALGLSILRDLARMTGQSPITGDGS